MKKINYFKFLEKFPEFIDIDDTEIVKLTFLSILKKEYWRKKEGDDPKLLPIKIINYTSQHFRNKELYDHNYCITFRNMDIIRIHLVKNEIFVLPVNNLLKSIYMTQDEIKNFKRNFILENIFEKNDY